MEPIEGEVKATTSKATPTLSGIAGGGANPRVEFVRETYTGRIHDSIDDDEMKEIDPDEHRETLGSGIPQYLAQQKGPKYVSPRVQSSVEEDSATGWTSTELEEDCCDDSIAEGIGKAKIGSTCMSDCASGRVLRTTETAEAASLPPEVIAKLNPEEKRTH